MKQNKPATATVVNLGVSFLHLRVTEKTEKPIDDAIPKRKKPPTIVFVLGISLIPNSGSQTQNIPPTTSVKDSKVNSAACIAFEPIEYKIKPKHTKVPCNENIALL